MWWVGLCNIAFLGLLQLGWPGYIHRVWYLNIFGGWVWGVPRAELLFALTLGMFWSGIYEQVLWLFMRPDSAWPPCHFHRLKVKY